MRNHSNQYFKFLNEWPVDLVWRNARIKTLKRDGTKSSRQLNITREKKLQT